MMVSARGCFAHMFVLCCISTAVLIRPSEDDQKDQSGAFLSSSDNFTAEVKLISSIMELAPGQTFCEMGGANGLFAAALGERVMPGGHLIVTAPVESERQLLVSALRGVDDQAQVIMATPEKQGFPKAACDVIFSRMVYHILPIKTAKIYLSQLKGALKGGGKMFILDWHPTNHESQRGKAHVALPNKRMPVVPMSIEVQEFVAAGFNLDKEYPNWKYFGGRLGDAAGLYGLLWS